jgi:enoyl-CoA hydratase/carnithine racemase
MMQAPTQTASTNAILLREDIASIAVLTLNRPQARNSLSEDLLAALKDALSTIAADTSVRAVVIAANGSAFCAGHDMRELLTHRTGGDGGRAYFTKLMDQCSSVMQTIVHLPQPVIAAVQGPATAAGCQLVASCDLAVASAAAGFCTPGVNIGFFCSTPTVALSRNVAPKHAMEMLLTGDMMSAEQALRMGLINRVVRPGEERDGAIRFARQIASKSAAVVKIGKQAFYVQIEMNLADAYRHASAVMVENMMLRDAAEGIGAFLEKRKPTWEDR